MRADCPVLYNNIYTNTFSNTETSTETTSDKNVNGTFASKMYHRNNSFCDGIDRVRQQVLRLCKAEECGDEETMEIIRVITYYYEKHDEVFVERHPFISDDAMLNVIRKMCEGTYDDEVPPIVEFGAEFYEPMIDKYLNTEFPNIDCDYHINHFMTNGIMAMRAYETQMNMN